MSSDVSLQGSPEVGRGPSRSRRVLSLLSIRRISAAYLLVVFIVVFSILNPATFLTRTTVIVVFNSGVVTCLLALAFLVPLATETYDLSIGAMMTFAVVLIVKLHLNGALPFWLLVPGTVVACICIGVVNGLLVTRLRITSFIATLASSQVLAAAALLISSNSTIFGNFADKWVQLGTGTVLGIPYSLVYLAAISFAIWFVFEWTPAGRYLFATGGNTEAARLSGVRTNRVIVASLAASGGLAALSGVLYTMQIGVANPSVGSGLLFPAVTAVFLGASQLSMRPNVWGTILAFFALQFGVQGLNLTVGNSASWSGPLFQGVALIVAVAIASRPVRARLRSVAGPGQSVRGPGTEQHAAYSRQDVGSGEAAVSHE